MPDLLGQVRSILETSVDRWAAISRTDASLLARRPAPGAWSAIQCLQHAVDTELAVFRARTIAIRDGADSFPGFDPETDGHVDSIRHTAPELVAELGPMRLEALATLATLTATDLERRSRHPELGPVSLAELLNEWAAHDTMHIVQAERAIMQAFIPGSGAWRGFFADHDVEAQPKDG